MFVSGVGRGRSWPFDVCMWRSRVPTKRWVCVGAVAAAWIAGCGSSSPPVEPTGETSSAIQGGAVDATHKFAVGLIQVGQQTVEICSGSLLAPNLVATARHCVSTISSTQIDCSTATFGALVPDTTLWVTTLTTIPQIPMKSSDFIPVASGGIVVPPASKVCGNDIAFLILNQNIVLPGGYAVPAISPPLTDPSRSTTVTAIGYGIDTPTDDGGVTAGTRRIKQNVGLACIPNDPNFIDCFADSTLKASLSPNEFLSGDQTTCEGDSGSGVYDQAAFDAGRWVSYGVLSRGSVSADGLSCVSPVYTRFDGQWAPLLIQTATTAAAMGGYAVPSWAAGGATADGGSTTGATVSGPGQGDGSSATVGADGTPCASDGVCLSKTCVAFDGAHFYCATPCGDGGACPSQFVCEGPAGETDYCFPASSVPGSPGGSGGCAIGVDRAPSAPLQPDAWLLSGVGTLLLWAGRAGRRSRRRRPTGLSGS